MNENGRTRKKVFDAKEPRSYLEALRRNAQKKQPFTTYDELPIGYSGNSISEGVSPAMNEDERKQSMETGLPPGVEIGMSYPDYVKALGLKESDPYSQYTQVSLPPSLIGKDMTLDVSPIDAPSYIYDPSLPEREKDKAILVVQIAQGARIVEASISPDGKRQFISLRIGEGWRSESRGLLFVPPLGSSELQALVEEGRRQNAASQSAAYFSTPDLANGEWREGVSKSISVEALEDIRKKMARNFDAVAKPPATSKPIAELWDAAMKTRNARNALSDKETPQAMPAANEPTAPRPMWAIVEITGGVTYGGFVTFELYNYAPFVRLEVEAYGDQPAFTKLFGAASVVCITPTSKPFANEYNAAKSVKPFVVWDGQAGRREVSRKFSMAINDDDLPDPYEGS